MINFLRVTLKIVLSFIADLRKYIIEIIEKLMNGTCLSGYHITMLLVLMICNDMFPFHIPALVKQFQPHTDTINSIQLFTRSERLLVLTASSDCAVALWDIEGRHIGIFGQVNKSCPTSFPVSPCGKRETLGTIAPVNVTVLFLRINNKKC